jgi:hypothetical protein
MRRFARYFLVTWFSALPIIYIVAVYHTILTIPRITVHHWTTGWEELGRVATREATTFEAEGGKKVFLLGVDTHYVAAALSFYTDGTRRVFARNLVGRSALAFDYWVPEIDLVGLNALAVDLNPPDLETLKKYFARVDDDVRRIPVMKGGRVLYYFYVVKCFDYLGVPPAV